MSKISTLVHAVNEFNPEYVICASLNLQIRKIKVKEKTENRNNDKIQQERTAGFF